MAAVAVNAYRGELHRGTDIDRCGSGMTWIEISFAGAAQPTVSDTKKRTKARDFIEERNDYLKLSAGVKRKLPPAKFQSCQLSPSKFTGWRSQVRSRGLAGRYLVWFIDSKNQVLFLL
jgi:hypothetical protein